MFGKVGGGDRLAVRAGVSGAGTVHLPTSAFLVPSWQYNTEASLR
ncbi:hypothetical protein [Streptomyces sp. S4.7]|nr:hypothetical protein [Streptomyces sp. S4.7]